MVLGEGAVSYERSTLVKGAFLFLQVLLKRKYTVAKLSNKRASGSASSSYSAFPSNL